MKLNSLLAAGLTLTALTSPVWADVTLVVTGGNATRAVVYNRAAAILTGETVVNGANSNIRSFINGTVPSLPALGNITIHFVLNGATKGIADLRDQVGVATTAGSKTAQLAISGAAPETVGIDPSIFTSKETLVVPFLYVKNSALPNSLGGVTNLTQRQAAYLQSASGSLPTAFFGGSSTTDPIRVIGRDTGAAVRQIIDANIYYTSTPTFYTTNAAGQPIINPLGGHDAAQKVVNDLLVIPNAIGTIAAGDIGTFTPLAYEGIAFSTANVAKGFYPIWGYERWLVKNSGAGQPTADQQTVINLLFNAVTDPAYQATSTDIVGKFVPLADLEVERTSDGGPITSILY